MWHRCARAWQNGGMFRKALVVFPYFVIGFITFLVFGVGFSPSLFFASLQPRKATVIWKKPPQSAYFIGTRQTVFMNDGKTLLSESDKIRIWDVATRALKSEFSSKGNLTKVYSVDGKQYAYHTSRYRSGDEASSQVKLHDSQNHQLVQTFNIPNATKRRHVVVNRAVFPPTGNLFNVNYTVSPKSPQNYRRLFTEVYTVWDRQTQKQIWSRSRTVDESTIRGYFQDPFFSPDGRQLWLLETDHTNSRNEILKVNLTDLLHDKKVATFDLSEKEYGTLGQKWQYACLSPQGSHLAAINWGGGDPNGTLFIFDIKTQQVISWERIKSFDTKQLIFSPDGKFLAWGGTDYSRFPISNRRAVGFVRLLAPRTGRTITEVTERNSLDFAKQIFVMGIETVKRLMKVKSNESQQIIPGETPMIGSLAFSPDSKKLAVGYADGSIKLWKIQ